MKKLYRSSRTRVLGGVAAGFAEYFGIDVTVMRLLFALLAILVPTAILAYILAWIIIPEEPREGRAVRETSTAKAGVEQMDDKRNEGRLPPTADELLAGKTDKPAGSAGDGSGSQPGEIRTNQPSTGGTLPPNELNVAPGSSAPPESQTRREVEPPKPAVREDRNRQFFGYALIVIGAAVLARRFVPDFLWRLPSRLIGQFWPVLIILVGVLLIFGAVRGR